VTDAHARLVKCFAAVFPRLSPEEIERANINSISAWDSLATLTLTSLIEEEFGVSIDPRDREDLVSFDLIVAYLRSDKGAEPPS
jgi:acyl carrier protein